MDKSGKVQTEIVYPLAVVLAVGSLALRAPVSARAGTVRFIRGIVLHADATVLTH